MNFHGKSQLLCMFEYFHNKILKMKISIFEDT